MKLDWKKYKNPFGHLSIAGIEDQREVPTFPGYGSQTEKYIQQIIEDYHSNRLSLSIVPIVGKTGSGKTFLLRKLAQQAQQAHQQHPQTHKPGEFWISIPPTEILKASVSTENTAQTIWQEIQDFLYRPILEEPYCRPLDIYAYRVARTIIENRPKEGEPKLYMKNLLGLKKRFPYAHFNSLVSFLESRNNKGSVDVLNTLLTNVDQSYHDTPEHTAICKWFLKQSYQEEKIALPLRQSSVVEKIGRFTYTSNKLNTAIVLVFDQFEDLEMVAEDVMKQVNIFLLKIFDLDRNIKKNASQLQCPLFLLSIFTPPSGDIFAKHIEDRFPPLIEGKAKIELAEELLRDFDKARNFASFYFQRHWQMIKAKEQHPLSDDVKNSIWERFVQKLAEKHKEFGETRFHITPRHWLKKCYHAWEEEINQLAAYEVTPSPPGSPEEPPPELPTFPKNLMDYVQNQESYFNSFEKLDELLEMGDSAEKERICLQIMRTFFLVLSNYKPSISPVKGVEKKSNFLSLKLNRKTLALKVCARRTQGGGCQRSWDEFYENVQQDKQNYHALVFMWIYNQAFPLAIPDSDSNFSSIIKERLARIDWAIIFFFIYLGNELSNMDDIWFKPNFEEIPDNFSVESQDVAHFLKNDWPLLQSILK